MQKKSQTRAIRLAAVLISAVMWVFFIKFNSMFFEFARQATGIGLIFIPAGVRLGLILIFGWWAALGVFLSNFFVFGDEFHAKSMVEAAVISGVAGFAPLLAVRISFWLLKIDKTLGALQPRHLPVIAFMAALTSAIAHNLVFTAFGYQSASVFITNTTMMMFGDFTGCFAVLVLMWGAIKLYRIFTSGP